MRHILIILYLFCFNATMVSLTRRRFGCCLPVSLMVMPLVMYFVQFACGSFGPAYILLLAFAVLGIPLALIRRRDFWESYCTLGCLAFVVVCAFIIVWDYRHFYNVWDEFSHWGVMTREMVRLDTWYAVPESYLGVHKDYPPFMQLLETMWCHYAGGYSEMACYYAIHIFSAGMIVPVIAENYSTYLERHANSKAGRFCRNLVMMAILMAFYMFLGKACDGGSTYTTIYKDIVVSLQFAYGMMLVAHRDALQDRFSYAALVLDVTALLMTKQMGMCYVLILWFYYVVMYILEHSSELEGTFRAVRGGILRLVPLVIIPYGIHHLWTAYTDSLGYVGQFDLGQIRLTDILAMMQDTYCETPQRQTFNAYISALLSQDLFRFPIPVSYVAAFLLVIALLYAAYRLRPDVFCKRDMLAMLAAFTCGTLGYALTMGVLYLFCFSEGEITSLASYERYLAPYVFAELLVIAGIYVEICGRMNQIRIMNALCVYAVCVVLLGTDNLNVFVPQGLFGEPNRDFQSIAARFDALIEEGGSVYNLSYDALRANVRLDYYAEHVSVMGDADALGDDLSDPATLAADTETTFGCDYLYVADVRDQFNEYFAQYNGGEDYIEGALYRITRDGDEIKAEMISEG